MLRVVVFLIALALIAAGFVLADSERDDLKVDAQRRVLVRRYPSELVDLLVGRSRWRSIGAAMMVR